MKQLIAADAYSENVIPVRADARPTPNRTAGSIYAVFSTATLGDEEGVFQGIVTDRDISYSPHRIFADLLNPHPLAPITEDTPLTQVEDLLSGSEDALAVVDKTNTFAGVVTHTSVLKALLKRERELLMTTQELNQQIAEDRQHLALWSNRLSELHGDSLTL